MITKALIKRTTLSNDNHFLVYIPLLRKANAPEESAIVSATAIVFPGAENVYNVNDVVYVGFEDDLADRPIILGKLYKGKEAKESITTTLTVKSAEVTEVTKLSGSTTIDNIDLSDVSKKLNWILNNNYLPAVPDEENGFVAGSDIITYNNKELEELKTVKEALDYIIKKLG